MFHPLLKARRLVGRAWRKLRPPPGPRKLPRFRAALDRHLAPAAGHPMYAVWREYASTSLARGEQAVATIRQYADVAGRRCLDVGCAYGGFPIACCLGGAREAVGVELDPKLLALARELLRDVPCNADLRAGDAMDGALVGALGTFDVITCNDVIEHVDDPLLLVEHLARLLRPGGTLFMEIPNKFCLEAVRKDGHYGLFGITLLERARALAYYGRAFAEPYTVGEYLHLPEYFAAMRGRGLDAYYLNPADAADPVVAGLRAGVAALAAEYPDRVPTLPLGRDDGAYLAARFGEYVEGFRALDARFRGAASADERARAGRELALTYNTYMWQLIVRKTGAVPEIDWRDRTAARSGFARA